jgi:hypothetical protein
MNNNIHTAFVLIGDIDEEGEGMSSGQTPELHTDYIKHNSGCH